MRERQNAMHSASAMADTNMEKKDFARRRRKTRRAKRRRENLLFRRTKQHFRRAITCRQLLFCATKKFIRRTKIPSREYKLASRKVHASSRQLKYFVAQVCTAITLYATTYFRRAKTHLHIGAKIKVPSFSYATVDVFVALSCLLRRKHSSRKMFLPP